jgi:hypothetical protein
MKIYKLIIATVFISLTAFHSIAQEDRKIIRGDTAQQQVDSTVSKKDRMPVVKPSDTVPPVPIPDKRNRINEDGMPVKTLPDSTKRKN